MPAVEILATGPLALIQDAGRPGLASMGVSPSGAADRAAYELGERLVGNAPGAAAIEVTFGGLAVRARGAVTLALTGARAPAQVNGTPVGHAAVVRLKDGDELALGAPAAGLRTYVCLRGALRVDRVLGSASTDTLSGLGPDPLRVGQVLELDDPSDVLPPIDHAPVPEPSGGTVTLRVLPGPRESWFADREELTRTTWSVSGRSDRKGVRLEGEALRRTPEAQQAELPSEGMVRGAIQVPGNGCPIIFLADHPVTGGYPVFGVLPQDDIDRAAQLVPGQPVRLRWERG